MGCVSSSPGDPWQATRQATEANKNLFDEFIVGKMLGEGGYGIVHACTKRPNPDEIVVDKRGNTEELAVKICRKESPNEEGRREAEMMLLCAHRNVVKCHGVFWNGDSVCIVMDKYGGDLVRGLQSHQKTKGRIDVHSIVHVSSQMAAAVQHLHVLSIVHRDIKGDNFLMDRKDITDAKCRIALTDFGTATELEPNERLHAVVGTQSFWAPEFFAKNYGLKVDIWAMGVVVCGLFDGKFPFKDESAVRKMDPRLPHGLHPSCTDCLLKMLHKDETKRISADGVTVHPWMRSCPSKREEQISPKGHILPRSEWSVSTGATSRYGCAYSDGESLKSL